MNRTANTRLQSRQLQAPCESSCGQRLVSPQYGQYWAGARFSLIVPPSLRERRTLAPMIRSLARSYQRLFVGALHPLREPLAGFPLRIEGLDDAFHVIGQIVARHLMAADLAAEPGVQTKSAAQVDLKSFHLRAG